MIWMSFVWLIVYSSYRSSPSTCANSSADSGPNDAPTILPGCTVLRAPVMTPCSTSAGMPPKISSVCTPRSRFSERNGAIAAETVPVPSWNVSPSCTISLATSEQITAASSSSSDVRGARRRNFHSRGASTSISICETWMRLLPPVRMKRSFTSPMTCVATAATSGAPQTLMPKLHQPSSSGGETLVRKTSGLRSSQ